MDSQNSATGDRECRHTWLADEPADPVLWSDRVGNVLVLSLLEKRLADVWLAYSKSTLAVLHQSHTWPPRRCDDDWWANAVDVDGHDVDVVRLRRQQQLQLRQRPPMLRDVGTPSLSRLWQSQALGIC